MQRACELSRISLCVFPRLSVHLQSLVHLCKSVFIEKNIWIFTKEQIPKAHSNSPRAPCVLSFPSGLSDPVVQLVFSSSIHITPDHRLRKSRKRHKKKRKIVQWGDMERHELFSKTMLKDKAGFTAHKSDETINIKRVVYVAAVWYSMLLCHRAILLS